MKSLELCYTAAGAPVPLPAALTALQARKESRHGKRAGDSCQEEIYSSVNESSSRRNTDSYWVSNVRQSAPERKDNGKEEKVNCLFFPSFWPFKR